jgi:phosphoglycolate phosphatase-like HAD superfamily hydrolase
MVTIGIPGHIFEKIELVIFDKDGTLMEVHHYWARMVRLRAELISSSFHLSQADTNILMSVMGVDPATGTIHEGGPVGIKKREDVMQAAMTYLKRIGYSNTRDLCERVFEVVDRISKDHLSEFVVPIPGAPELVRSLSEHGCRIAIATTDRASRGALAMECLGIGKYISLIVGADMVKNTKPDPEMVRLILKHQNIGKKHTLMIGDAITDVQMGVDADLLGSIAVLTGFTKESELRMITPHIVQSVAKISVS